MTHVFRFRFLCGLRCGFATPPKRKKKGGGGGGNKGLVLVVTSLYSCTWSVGRERKRKGKQRLKNWVTDLLQGCKMPKNACRYLLNKKKGGGGEGGDSKQSLVFSRILLVSIALRSKLFFSPSFPSYHARIFQAFFSFSGGQKKKM